MPHGTSYQRFHHSGRKFLVHEMFNQTKIHIFISKYASLLAAQALLGSDSLVIQESANVTQYSSFRKNLLHPLAKRPVRDPSE